MASEIKAQWKYPNDWHEFDAKSQPICEMAEALVTEMFGERCIDYSPGCLCCQRWQHLDLLLANPFDQPQSEADDDE